MTAAYVVTRKTPNGGVTSTHRGRIDTDGPWLIVWDGDEPELILPAHVVVSVERVTEVPGG